MHVSLFASGGIFVALNRDVDNFLEVEGLSLYGAVGSNLRMVRPSSMSVVKLLIIHACKARGNILDLASYLVVRWRSHCTSPSNWELLLLCYRASAIALHHFANRG